MVRMSSNRYREYRSQSYKKVREKAAKARHLAEKRSLRKEQGWQHAYEYDNHVDFENIRNVSLNID